MDNLHFYELVMLILGAVLFLILSCALVYLIIKKEDYKKLLLFFSVPIIMMSYSGIKEVSVSADKYELTKSQEAYAENPNDQKAKEKLEELTEKLGARAKSEEDLVQIGKSKILLNKAEETLVSTQKVLEKHPELKSTDGLIAIKPTEGNRALIETINLKNIATIQQESIEQKDTAGLQEKVSKFILKPEQLKLKSVKKLNLNTD